LVLTFITLICHWHPAGQSDGDLAISHHHTTRADFSMWDPLR
jgi:hypothetical protein